MSQEKELLKFLASIAAIDNSREVGVLLGLGDAIGVDVEDMMGSVGSSTAGPPSGGDAEGSLDAIARMMLADGAISDAEKSLLDKAATQLGVSPERSATVIRKSFTQITGLSGNQRPEQKGTLVHLEKDLRAGLLSGAQNQPVAFDWDALHLIEEDTMRKLTDAELLRLTPPQPVLYRRKKVGDDSRIEVSTLVVLTGKEEPFPTAKVSLISHAVGTGELFDKSANLRIDFTRFVVEPRPAFFQLETTHPVWYQSRDNKNADVVIPKGRVSQ